MKNNTSPPKQTPAPVLVNDDEAAALLSVWRVKEVAERYDVTEHTVIGWIHDGELQAVDVSRKRGGKPRWRITQEALEGFESSRTMHPPAAKSRRRKRKRDEDVIEFYK